jgi:hypothetical protein
MAQKILSVGNKFTTLLLIAVVATVSVISCTKTKQPDANAIFIGDWVGGTTCWYSNRPDTVRTTNVTEFLGAESGAGNLITIGESFGYADCYLAVPVIGTVNGNYFAIAPQNFSDKCGAGYLISGSGNLSTSGTLTVSTTKTSTFITTCVFTGVKQ